MLIQLFKTLAIFTRMATFNRKVLGLLVIGCIISVFACSGQSETKKAPRVLDQPIYKGWVYYDSGNIRIFYPPGHPLYSEFESIAAGYHTALKGITDLLVRPLPTDTLTIVFYNDYNSAVEITGQKYPYVEGNLIHFWMPSFYGTTLTQWYLPRWVPKVTRHQFLKHGLVSLFDHSGQNYHANTLRFIEEQRFIPLATLAIDDEINSNIERYNSTEAASFCAFVIAWYGPEVLEGMYRYDLEFDQFVRGAFDMSVDSLETVWLEVIRANQPDPTTDSTDSQKQ